VTSTDGSKGSSIDKDRFFSMAETYDAMCRKMVPGCDWLQEQLIRILQFLDARDPVLVDLGAGSAIFIERVLTAFPGALCYRDATVSSMRYWAHFVDRAGESTAPGMGPQYRAWCERFEGWKRRNIEHSSRPKKEGDDIHAPFLEQMRMLHRIGFLRVDVFAKRHLWCMIGGRKPAERPGRAGSEAGAVSTAGGAPAAAIGPAAGADGS